MTGIGGSEEAIGGTFCHSGTRNRSLARITSRSCGGATSDSVGVSTGVVSPADAGRHRLSRPIAASLPFFRQSPVDLRDLSYETLTDRMLQVEDLVERPVKVIGDVRHLLV
jgi:hypothetical protein